MSQVVRPPKYNIGGFFKSLSQEYEIAVPEGTIAFGYKGQKEIVSRTNNKTWILANTDARIPRQQMVDMLSSLRHP
jgi:hypothetical protein